MNNSNCYLDACSPEARTKRMMEEVKGLGQRDVKGL